MTAWYGAPTRCGPARRNGRSRRCGGSKSPRTCRRNTASGPVGAADGPIKTAIFGGTNAKLYNYDVSKRSDIGPTKDRFARMKDEYERNGPARSNLRYGYVRGAGRLVGVRLGAPDELAISYQATLFSGTHPSAPADNARAQRLGDISLTLAHVAAIIATRT